MGDGGPEEERAGTPYGGSRTHGRPSPSRIYRSSGELPWRFGRKKGLARWHEKTYEAMKPRHHMYSSLLRTILIMIVQLIQVRTENECIQVKHVSKLVIKSVH